MVCCVWLDYGSYAEMAQMVAVSSCERNELSLCAEARPFVFSSAKLCLQATFCTACVLVCSRSYHREVFCVKPLTGHSYEHVISSSGSGYCRPAVTCGQKIAGSYAYSCANSLAGRHYVKNHVGKKLVGSHPHQIADSFDLSRPQRDSNHVALE